MSKYLVKHWVHAPLSYKIFILRIRFQGNLSLSLSLSLVSHTLLPILRVVYIGE